jgi:hypothetical protein
MAQTPTRAPYRARLSIVVGSVLVAIVALLGGSSVAVASAPQPRALEPTAEPTPSNPPPTPTTPSPAPTMSPKPTATAPPVGPSPVVPSKPRLGIALTTGDVRLTDAYWASPATEAALLVTVVNSGQIAERIVLTYTLDAGVTDAGNPGCAATRGTVRCGAQTLERGERRTIRVRLRVSGAAWQRMPLGGSVGVTATGAGRDDLAVVRDKEAFAVLFPPGPPVAGIDLRAADVRFPPSGSTSTLTVTLTNRGAAAARGAVEVELPADLAVEDRPPTCTPVDRRVRCDLDEILAGRAGTLTLVITAPAARRPGSAVSGAVFGVLTGPGTVKRMRASFRIFTGPAPGSVGEVADPSGEATVAGFAPVSGSETGSTTAQRAAMALVLGSSGLIVCALVLAVVSLRRRRNDDAGRPAGSSPVR